jgi:hypothetical protein
MREFCMSGSAGVLGEQSPETTRPGLLPLPQAVPPYLERECAVTAFLCDRSDCVPRVIAVDRKKRWMLQRGFHGSSVEDCDDLRVWISALES